MKTSTLSGPAIFMYASIALMAALTIVFFTLYYANVLHTDLIMWCGIVSFMILYHFGLRILFGEFTKKLNIDYKHPFFSKKSFENKIFEILKVRKWKDKVLTFDPASYDFKNRTPKQLATTMCKSEIDHWINEAISVFSILFALLWGQLWIFLLTALLAMAFDAQFIIVQRYNRPHVIKLIELKENKTKKATV